MDLVATIRNHDTYIKVYGISAEIKDEDTTDRTGYFQSGLYEDVPSFSIL